MSKLWYWMWCATIELRAWLLCVGNWMHAKHVRAQLDEERVA